MPVQPSRASVLVRPFVVCAALLIVVQVVIAPAAAAPARQDDELTAAPLDEADEAAVAEGDEAAVEPIHGTDEEAVAPSHDEDEPEAEPAHQTDELADEPIDIAEEPAGLLARDDDVIAAPSAAPARDGEEVADAFLMRLLAAINERRDRNGTRPLAFVPARANAALDRFFAETVAGLGWPGPCTHDFADGGVAWDAVLAAGFGGAPRGEVLACPGPEPYWTPDRTAEQWWHSPIHFDVFYADGDSDSIACSAHGVQAGANEGEKQKRKEGGSPSAASAVICVTFQR